MGTKQSIEENRKKIAAAMMELTLADDPYLSFQSRLLPTLGELSSAIGSRDSTSTSRDRTADLGLASVPPELEPLEARETRVHGLLALWEKAGVPKDLVKEVLNGFDPNRKRHLMDSSQFHTDCRELFRTQRSACQELLRLVGKLAVLPPANRSHIQQTANNGLHYCDRVLKALKNYGAILHEGKRKFGNVRNLSQKTIAHKLWKLREKYVQEGSSQRSRRIAELLSKWAPSVTWNANSIRANNSSSRS